MLSFFRVNYLKDSVEVSLAQLTFSKSASLFTTRYEKKDKNEGEKKNQLYSFIKV